MRGGRAFYRFGRRRLQSFPLCENWDRRTSWSWVAEGGCYRRRGESMRMNIEIDDKLMIEAMRCVKKRTKRETVEAALRMLVRVKKQGGIRKLRGKVQWEGNLDELRGGRF